MNRARPFLIAATVIGALAAAVVVQEYAVRLALPAYNPAGHLHFEAPGAAGVTLGPRNTVQRLVKNSGDYDVAVRFNRYGLRDSRDLATATAEDYFVVGDSFAFGWGVAEEQRFSNRLETLTGRRVFNIATTTDFDGYARLLRYAAANGATVRKVIVAVNMIDDLQPYADEPHPAKVAAAARAAPPPAAAGLGLMQVKNFLTAHSALYFLATSLVHHSAPLQRLAIDLGLVIPIDAVGRSAVTPRVIERSARRLAEILRPYDATVLIIPARGLWVGARRADEDRIHRLAVARFRALGLDVVDPRPAFEATGHPMQYHFANDGHWNAAGHAKVAELLARHLAARRRKAAVAAAAAARP